MLTPLIHCTLSGNGDTPGWSVEFAETPNLASFSYNWFNQISGNVEFATELDNTIFQRKVSNDTDFGPTLANKAVGTVSGVFAGSGAIGVGGVRAKVPPPLLIGNFPESTDLSVEYAGLPGGGVNYGVGKASQFFLDPGGANNIAKIIDMTLDYLNAPQQEQPADYEGDSRPPVITGDSDKGGDES